MSIQDNICPNGNFDHLQVAAARALPQDWREMRSGETGLILITDTAIADSHVLQLRAPAGGMVGMDSAEMPVRFGQVKVRYKVEEQSPDQANLALFIVALDKPGGVEVARQTWLVPAEQSGGEWQEASIDFDFRATAATRCYISLRINEGTPSRAAGEWLLDAVEVYSLDTGPQLRIANLWVDKPCAWVGEEIVCSAFIENTGDAPATGIQVTLDALAAVIITAACQTIPELIPGAFARIDWQLQAQAADRVKLEVSATLTSPQIHLFEADSYTLLILAADDNYTRQQLCTDDAGFWRILPRPETLQEGNAAPLTAIRHKKSSEIGHNPYGLCAQIPRARDYEDPFNPAHLIDGDPDTVWSSQQNASPYPGRPPWAQIDLGQEATIAQVNLLPYWRNSAFPLGFSIHTSRDGHIWHCVLNRNNYQFVESAEKRGDKFVQAFRLDSPVSARYLRVDFERLPRAHGNYAEVSEGYKARLSGIEVIDETGENIALLSRGATATVSDCFTCWQNTAQATNESFERLFDLGIKWIRIGQWGDQNEWAAVERVKGVFAMDPVCDAAINRLLDNGIGILFGLQYGNVLYGDRDEPWLDIGPIYKEGHPFYLNCGPRTEEGRQAFVRYVDFVVRKYGDRITWWELWNEENGWFPEHQPELYGKLLLAVAKHIKSINPNLKVMCGGTAAPAPITTEIALREGAAPYLDAYAFHPYGISKPEGGMGTMEFYEGKNISQSPEQTGWTCLEEVIAGVKQPFIQQGNPNIEVWLNEWGTNLTGREFTYDPHVGEYGLAKYLMRFYVYAGWLTLPMAWWAFYNQNMSQDWGIIERHGYGLRPGSYALQNVCSVLSDVTPRRDFAYTLDTAAPDPKVISYTQDDNGNTVIALWAAEMNDEVVKAYPGKLTFPLASRPAQVTLTDLYWGLSQPAVWSYDNGLLTIPNLIMRDYPLAITIEA
jgi:hypothetical protein